MKNKFLEIHNLLAGVRGGRQERKNKIASLKAELTKYNKLPNDFAYQIKSTQSELSRLEAERKAEGMAIHKALLEGAEELEKLLTQEANKPLDLSDTKFVNALQIASLTNLDYAQATSLAEQFRGNHAALRLLKNKFAEKQIHSGIDELIVDPMKVKSGIENVAFNVAQQDGSPESLMRFISQAAKQNGIDLPDAGNVDFDNGMRRGAGLPEATPAAAGK